MIQEHRHLNPPSAVYIMFLHPRKRQAPAVAVTVTVEKVTPLLPFPSGDTVVLTLGGDDITALLTLGGTGAFELLALGGSGATVLLALGGTIPPLGTPDWTGLEAGIEAAGGATGPTKPPAFVHAAPEHFWYSDRASGPPQYSVLLPLHFMLQLPKIPGCGARSAAKALPHQHLLRCVSLLDVAVGRLSALTRRHILVRRTHTRCRNLCNPPPSSHRSRWSRHWSYRARYEENRRLHIQHRPSPRMSCQ